MKTSDEDNLPIKKAGSASEQIHDKRTIQILQSTSAVVDHYRSLSCDKVFSGLRHNLVKIGDILNS